MSSGSETLVEHVAGLAGVAEGFAGLLGDDLAEGAQGLLEHAVGERVALALAVASEYLGKLFGGVVVDVDAVGEAALEARVGLHQVAHLGLVARADEHELAPVVLHSGHQPLKCLETFAVVALPHVVEGRQSVGFVEEEHPSHGLVDGLVHLLVGFVGVAAHYVLATLLDHPVGGADAHGLE